MRFTRTRRCIFLFTAIIMLMAAVIVPASAETLTAKEKADALHELGIFNGRGTLPDGTPDYALDDGTNRDEMAGLLITLLGKRDKAKAQYDAGVLSMPFWDVEDWAVPYVAWLYSQGYINGTSATTYEGMAPATAQHFATIILHALGYFETKGDFSYDRALDFAVSKGLLTSAQREAWEAGFTRAGIAEMSYNALYLNMNGSKLTLLSKLMSDGVFKASYVNSLFLGPAKPLTLTPLYTGGGSTDRWSVEERADSNPAVADVDGDGAPEIIFMCRNVFCLNAKNGKIKWQTPSGHEVTEKISSDSWFGAATAGVQTQILDVDGDWAPEIVTFATNYPLDSTFVGIYNGFGEFKYSFRTQHAVRAVKIADLDLDGKYEFIFGFGTGEGNDANVTVCRCDGTVLPGWPQRCGYGLYSNTIETADLDGDGAPEIVMLFDEDQIAAFHIDGSPVYATGGPYAGLRWIGLPVCENYDHELEAVQWARNYGGTASGQGDNLIGNTRESRNINTGTYGGVVADDMDGDGKKELVFTSMILDGGLVMRNGVNSYDGIARYFTTFILNTDRTRYKNEAKGFDWTQMPRDIGEIVTLCTAPSYLSVPDISPVTADIDWDGNKEIIFTSFDGKVHCFSLDGTEHGAWPYSLDTRETQVKTFATKPTVADVNGDGMPEVIFGTYTESNQTTVRGRLYVLDGAGRELASIAVPIMWGLDAIRPPMTVDRDYADGIFGQPSVADVDGDGRPEIIVTTFNCGVCVYKVS